MNGSKVMNQLPGDSWRHLLNNPRSYPKLYLKTLLKIICRFIRLDPVAYNVIQLMTIELLKICSGGDHLMLKEGTRQIWCMSTTYMTSRWLDYSFSSKLEIRQASFKSHLIKLQQEPLLLNSKSENCQLKSLFCHF